MSLPGVRMLELHIEVADLDRACEFYRQLLPHEKVVRWPDGQAVALVMADGTAFGLWKQGKQGINQGQGGAHLHFAFQIDPADYDVFRDKLLKLGVEPKDYVWPGGQRSIYFFDADGHQGEFMTCDWFGFSI